jgi:glucosamine-6-phosphate deaminase
MEEKSKEQQGEELLDVDNKGKVLEKKEEPKKPKEGSETFTHVLAIFLALVLLGLFLKIFVFYQNTEKNKVYHKYKTPEDMNRNVGETIIRYIKQKPNARIGLASGTTPEGLYQYLIHKYEKGEVSFKDVQFFSIDGFCGLSKDDKNSYYYALTNSFLNKIDAQEKNIHLLREEGADLKEFEKNAEDYNNLLKEKPIDLQILSFGENGHIGFNEPNTDFSLRTHVVKLTDEKRKDKSKIFGSLDKTPEYAITQGVQSILEAKEVLAIAKGKGKAQAVKGLVNGVYTQKSPITALIVHPGKVTVFTDEEAGSLISEFNKKF